MTGPCMCGALDCSECYPGGDPSESEAEAQEREDQREADAIAAAEDRAADEAWERANW